MEDYEGTLQQTWCDKVTKKSERFSGWSSHVYRCDRDGFGAESTPDPDEHQHKIRPWLSALFQAEHLNVLVGSGLTTGVCFGAKIDPLDMSTIDFTASVNAKIKAAAEESAQRMGRGGANIEDQFRVALELLRGLRILGDGSADVLEAELNEHFRNFLRGLIGVEQGLVASFTHADDAQHTAGIEQLSLVIAFLLSFASRSPARERAHVFTSNYDRLLEFACDRAGLRAISRFVGNLTPEFRSTRVDVDLHYNPPGIRGEPRYLEGVLRLSKIHGSLDWRYEGRTVRQELIPFGSPLLPDSLPEAPLDAVIIYPNSVKDIETAFFPYAEIFRDFSGALCRPNSVLFTYGYGFGDSHINRIISEMLTIPSTHLVIVSFDDAGGRIRRFFEATQRNWQITLLLGNHFGALKNLCEYYLPSPHLDLVRSVRDELRASRSGPSTGTAEAEDLDDEVALDE